MRTFTASGFAGRYLGSYIHDPEPTVSGDWWFNSTDEKVRINIADVKYDFSLVAVEKSSSSSSSTEAEALSSSSTTSSASSLSSSSSTIALSSSSTASSSSSINSSSSSSSPGHE